MYQSQFGEDRLIEEELARIGTRNKWCFEVGAGDGVKFSNVHYFIHQLGWNAILIEADAAKYEALRQFESEKVRTYHQTIGIDDLDGILADAGAPQDPDFGVIDIDGQDFYVWERLKHSPRVMCVEFSPYVDPMHMPGIGECGKGGYNQAGEAQIRKLGDRLGYALMAKTRVNMLFTKRGAA